MAITLHGAVGVPTDNGTNTANPTAFNSGAAPLSTAQAGDLVFVYAYCRTSSATIAVSNAGGQTWTSGTSVNSTNATLSANWFWCVFNGTWSAAPSFSFGATTNNNVVMLVFRGSFGTANGWATDQNAGTFVQEAAAATFTLTSSSTLGTSTVSIGVWNTDDDNTWGTLTGSGWSKTSLSAQYRNTSGQDTSASFAYNIQTSPASIAQVAQTELTLGNDAGLSFTIAFKEYDKTWNSSFVQRDMEQPYFQKKKFILSGQKAINPTREAPTEFFLSDPDAIAWLDAAGHSSTDTVLRYGTDRLIKNAKVNGWWSVCDIIYLFFGDTANKNKLNVKDPRDLDAAYRLSFTGTWIHSRSIKTTQSSGNYADTFYVPASHLTDNNWHLSAFTNTYKDWTGASAADAYDIGVSESGSTLTMFLSSRNDDPTVGGYSFGRGFDKPAGNIIGTTKAFDSHVLLQRTSSTNMGIYVDGTLSATNTNTQTSGLPSVGRLWVGALNNTGVTYGVLNREQWVITVGRSMSDSVVALMSADIKAFMKLFGR